MTVSDDQRDDENRRRLAEYGRRLEALDARRTRYLVSLDNSLRNARVQLEECVSADIALAPPELHADLWADRGTQFAGLMAGYAEMIRKAEDAHARERRELHAALS